MPIVLVGPRCSGKTTIGKRLASSLQCPFADADELFVEGYGAISEFVDKHGWEKFRRLETDLIVGVCAEYALKDIIFAPGGGAVAHNQGEDYRKRNVEVLRRFGHIFYLLPYQDLKRSAGILVARMKGDSGSSASRPSLTGDSDLEREMLVTLERRDPLYRAVAGYVIYTEESSQLEVADAILATYRKIAPRDR